jgi:hypothetical protein
MSGIEGSISQVHRAGLQNSYRNGVGHFPYGRSTKYQ